MSSFSVLEISREADSLRAPFVTLRFCSDLEQAVESLSELLERPLEEDKIAELRQQTTDKTVYVTKRCRVLLEDTIRGYDEVSAGFSDFSLLSFFLFADSGVASPGSVGVERTHQDLNPFAPAPSVLTQAVWFRLRFPF